MSEEDAERLRRQRDAAWRELGQHKPRSLAACWGESTWADDDMESPALWAVGPRPRGRRPGVTDIPNDDELRAAFLEMSRAGVRVTRATLAARAGYTESALRGYLRKTRRTMEELVTQFATG